jgi:citrate lyase subunit beta/citryl-CoA lyase
MAILVRRSNLMVRVTDADMLSHAWRHHADAVTLDLEGGAAAARKAEARGLVKQAIAPTGQAAAEVFVRVNKSFLQADLEASVWPGLRGIMLPQVESAAEVMEAAEMVTTLERRRGIAAGLLCFIVLLESARAVWDIRAIITASPRITQVGLDECDLADDLGIDPVPEYDPFVYARGRLAVEATAARVSPVGMAYPLSVQPRAAPQSEIHTLATKARNLGMKGVICPHPDWVEPVNAAFTPTAELVAYNKRVREAFAAGVAAGTAAVPLDGRMIDVPVDEWAIVVIATAEACAARDAEKQAALSRLSQR